ncbi:hypothetical protein IWW34DRAFT_198897 [Fusarium oxysporum f. sp. albedinis]|nr:hypothetical protein IWW34DRAFT_198897 [Fusarium oxysporum f. sp. albedinis]
MFLIRLPLSLFMNAADKIVCYFPCLIDSIPATYSSRSNPYGRPKILLLYSRIRSSASIEWKETSAWCLGFHTSFKPGCHFCNFISMENMKFVGHGEYGQVVSVVLFLIVSSLTSAAVFGFTHNTMGSFPGERYSVREDPWDRHVRDFHL